MNATVIPRGFFGRPAVQVAPELLGCVLWHGPVAVRLTEVEAYMGAEDPASHAYRGRTRRNAVMFGPPGHAYVYFTYGMHFCVNLVCLGEGVASAVLLRAGEIVAGEELATQRRGRAAGRELARGPARLCQALGIDRALDGADVCNVTSALLIRRDAGAPAQAVASGPRVGVSSAAQVPWRFWLAGEPTVSLYRPHVPRVRRNSVTLLPRRGGTMQA